MSAPETPPSVSLPEYLCTVLPVQIFVVGDLPDLSQPVAQDAVSVYRHASLEEALTQAMSLSVTDTPSTKDTSPPHQVLVLDMGSAEQDSQLVLGRAVRAFPHGVIVRCNNLSLDDAWFFALGFNRLQVNFAAQAESDPSSWFEYRLSRYKASPDWLNAQYWANPERFHKDEEPDIYCDDSDDDEE